MRRGACADATRSVRRAGRDPGTLSASVTECSDVHTDLGKSSSADANSAVARDTFVFDSTGMTLEDIAAAAVPHEPRRDRSRVSQWT